MGNVCLAKREDIKHRPDLDSHPNLCFDEIMERNLDTMNELRKVTPKDKSFADFMKRKGKISVTKEKDALSLQTLRMINRYRDEWVFIQLEEKWAQVLKARREKVANVQEYIKLYKEDMIHYNDTLAKAEKEILAEHSIKREEFRNSVPHNDRNSLVLENELADILWTYWAFKDSGVPKLMKDAELLKDVELVKKTVDNHKKDVLELLGPSSDKVDLAHSDGFDKQELALVWAVEMTAKEQGINAENFLLSYIDKKGKTSNRKLYNQLETLVQYIYIPTYPKELQSYLKISHQQFLQNAEIKEAELSTKAGQNQSSETPQ
jgi:hypothetical protein